MSGFGLAMRCDRPIGRERELKTIERVLDGTAGRSILVTGAEGSGLAGFVNMAATDARSRGLEVVVGTLKEEDPLGSFVNAVLSFAEPHLKEAPNQITAALAGVREVLDRPHLERWKRRELLHIAFGTVLAHLMKTLGRSLVLVIHNQHLSTPLIMELFSRIAHSGRPVGLSLQYVFAANPSLWKAGANPRQRFPGALHLHLKPLSVRQVALTVGSMLYRRPPPDRLARVIHHLSGGEPVWVEQVVQHMVDAGQLRALGAEGNHLEWDSEEIGSLSVPTDAEDAVRLRFCALPTYARRSLEALSICGQRASLDVLSHSLGWDAASFEPIVELLVADGWLERSEDSGEVQWVRTLDASTIEKHVDEQRRQVFMRSLGRMVEKLPASATLVSVLLAQGQTRRGMEMALSCARQWMDQQAVLKALDLLDEVVEAVKGRPDLDRIFAGRLHLMHADCLMRLRPIDPRLSRSLGIARSLANKQVTLATIELLQARLHRQLGHFPGFRKYVQRAWEHATDTDDDGIKSRIASYQMQGWLTQGRMGKAREWLAVAQQHAKATKDERVIAYSKIMVGQLVFLQGRIGEAEEVLSEALEVFRRTGHRRGLWLAVPYWSEILRFQGRFSEALSTLYQELPEARSSQVPLHYLQILLGIARCEIDLCRLGKAQDCVDELEVNIRRGEQLSLRLDTMLVKGRIQIMSGQYRKALAVLQKAHEQARSAELPVVYEYARSLMAEALWGLNSKEQAAGMFESACLGLLATGNVATLVLASISWAHGMSGTAPSESIFQSVEQFLEDEPVHVLRIEQSLTSAQYYKNKKDRPKARYHFKKAAEQLNQLSASLNNTDRAALRVHPWSVQIRVGLG